MTLAALALALAAWQAKAETTVGMPARVEQLVLPGPELEVVPAEPGAPLVLRIAATWPHGDAFRYDLEFWALEPGEYDLAAQLRRADGSAAALEPIPVAVRSVLPPGQRVPNEPGEGAVRSLGGYRSWIVAAAVAWLVGLVAILSKRRRRHADAVAAARPKSLAEQLEPLVERARAGELSSAERAQLELGLVAYWRRKLALDELPPHQALARLRDHSEAGPLLVSLERWLHDPASGRAIDVARLLEPYRGLAAGSIDLPGVPAARAG